MKFHTKAYLLMFIISLQSLLILFIVNQTFMGLLNHTLNITKISYPLPILLNLLSISSIVSIYYVFRMLLNEKEAVSKLNHSQEVIDALHGQKHDFANHLNLLSGFLQVGKYEKALEYIFSIAERVDEVYSASKIENIEIAATIFKKCAIAEGKGIIVEMDITTTLEDLKMNPLELCRVLFNLLDNAIYALERSSQEEKILSIEIQETEEHLYSIAITNSDPVLDPSLYEKIFEPRFSTKVGEEHGYGLSIVKNIIEKNKGRIKVKSIEHVGTTFTLCLPKKTKSLSLSVENISSY